MNHEHESVGGTPSIDIPFWIHRDDVAAINRTVPIDGQFEQRETIADDLEVIPTQDIRQVRRCFCGIMTNIVSFYRGLFVCR